MDTTKFMKWIKICNAIINFTAEYGAIEIIDKEAETTMFLNGGWDCSEVGKFKA